MLPDASEVVGDQEYALYRRKRRTIPFDKELVL